MNYQIIKFLKIFIFVFVIFTPVTFANDCSQNFINSSTENTPLTAILCPVYRILNIAIAVSGAVFALFVIYAGSKLALSLGDPKGYDAAKWSLTYSVIGFAIIMGFFTIFKIVLGLFGVDGIDTPAGPFESVKNNINTFNSLIRGN